MIVTKSKREMDTEIEIHETLTDMRTLEAEAETEALYMMKRNNYLVYYIKMEPTKGNPFTKGAPSLL